MSVSPPPRKDIFSHFRPSILALSAFAAFCAVCGGFACRKLSFTQLNFAERIPPGRLILLTLILTAALLTIGMVVYLSVRDRDFGPMRKQELLARELDYAQEEPVQQDVPNGKVSDMIIPIVALIIITILGMLYNGGFFGGDYHMDIIGALGNCVAAEALTWGGLCALILAFLMYVPRKLMSFNKFMDGVTEGMKTMVMPLTTPGTDRGSVTLYSVRKLLQPRSAAASVRR